MIFIYIFIAFFAGIAFIQWGLPLVDSVINLILTLLEVWKGNLAVKITNYQLQVTSLKEKYENNQSPTQAIGFMISEEGEEEFYD